MSLNFAERFELQEKFEAGLRSVRALSAYAVAASTTSPPSEASEAEPATFIEHELKPKNVKKMSKKVYR